MERDSREKGEANGGIVFNSDYDVFLSPLSDFKAEMDKAGLSDKVVYLDRGDGYKFKVQQQ